MEKRLFRFGESSLALIVPKKWADKNRITTSSRINIIENSNGDIVISSKDQPAKEREEIIKANISSAALSRLIGLHYLMGTTKLRLYFKDSYKKKTMQEITDMIKEECPGFEMINYSSKDILIEDFNNLRDTDLLKIIRRLRLIIKQEFREVKDKDMAALEESEKLVNRFYMLGVRHINMLNTEQSTKYFVILQMLELISDNLNLLCQPNGIRDMSLMNKLEEQFDMCFAGLEGNRESIEDSIALREQIYSKSRALKLDKIGIHTMQELTNEISRISEFGLYLNGGIENSQEPDYTAKN